MGILERLTYLLGVCVAVITWSVAQLSAAITADEVLAYSTSTSHPSSANSQQTFTLENLSRSQRPSSITVDVSETKNGCITSFTYIPDSVALVVQADAAVDPGRHGYERVKLNEMPPGARATFETQYKSTCTVTPRLAIVAGSDSHPRLLEEGLETWVIRSQFWIYVVLIILFGMAFVFTYVASYVAAKGKPG